MGHGVVSAGLPFEAIRQVRNRQRVELALLSIGIDAEHQESRAFGAGRQIEAGPAAALERRPVNARVMPSLP